MSSPLVRARPQYLQCIDSHQIAALIYLSMRREAFDDLAICDSAVTENTQRPVLVRIVMPTGRVFCAQLRTCKVADNVSQSGHKTTGDEFATCAATLLIVSFDLADESRMTILGRKTL